MKKSTILALGLLFSSTTFCVTASANLLGDTIHMSHNAPDAGTVFLDMGNVVVTAGTGDQANFFGSYLVNPEADTISLSFLTHSFWSSLPFNGLVLSGFDDLITSVTVSTDMIGWDDSHLSFTGSTISSNFSGLESTVNTYFVLSINQAASVPDSGSMLGMLGCILAGFVVIRRKLVTA